MRSIKRHFHSGREIAAWRLFANARAGTDMSDHMTSAPALAAAPPLDVSRHALFLDIDGTLLDLAPTPEEVSADTALSALLRTLALRLDGALAVLTGRAVIDADRILGGAVDCVAGLHGQEWRVGAQILRGEAGAETLPLAREAVDRLVSGGALDARVEDKGGALALHYRHAPEQGALVSRAVQEIATLHGLRALHGNMVSELMPHGATKGGAVLALMSEPPFAGRVPVAVGDDVTDEDAFAAVNELGGVSVLVGAPRKTAAKHKLANVAAVRDWLKVAVEQ
jgi:trehalose 6-phosphate phosphatase